MHDLKLTLRGLARSRGFAAVVILTLAFGVAANATVWCWIDHLVWRPLPGVPRQEEMALVVSSQGGGNVSLLDLRDLASGPDRLFAGAVGFQFSLASLLVDGEPEWLNAQMVTANFFDVLEVRPILGRTFVADEDRKPDGNPVLVISERLWRRRFGADPGVLGRVVDVNRHAFTIVGVAPDSFPGTVPAFRFDLWAPASMIWEIRNQRLDGRSARGWHNLARLRPGVTADEASAAVAVRNAQLALAYPQTNRDVRHHVVPFSRSPYGAQAVMGPVLRLLLGVSLAVLLIVAVNVASLQLARASARQKEIAIQAALGASRLRLVRLVLVESVSLALAGGALGALLAAQAVKGLPFFLPAVPPGVELEFSLDAKTLAFTLGLSVATGLLFGLATAFQGTRLRVYETLKDGGRSSGSPGHHRVRSLLVVSEVGLAVVLLVGAGLCLQGLRRTRQLDLGLDPRSVLIASLQIGMNGYTADTAPAFYRELQARVAALPGVEDAALASWFPLGLAGCKGSGVLVEGHERAKDEALTYEYAIVSPRYFGVTRTPLVAGREFDARDSAGADAVAIVNQAFAERFWPGADPIGRRFRSRGSWRRIVGVARTGKYNRLDEGQWPFFYLPYEQGVPDLDLSLAVRTKGDPAARAEAVRGAIRGLDPAVDVLRVFPLQQHVEGVFFPQRMASTLLVLLGGVALLLAAMGVYGVMAYSVARRTQEFGVRMALGASTRDIVWAVLRRGLGLAAAGVVAGVALAVLLARVMTGFLFGVSPFDAMTYAGVCSFLLGVTLVACSLPAWRATRVDPVVALRSE